MTTISRFLALFFGASVPLNEAAIPAAGDSFSPLLLIALAVVVVIAILLIIVALRKTKAQDKAEAGVHKPAATGAGSDERRAQDAASDKRGRHAR